MTVNSIEKYKLSICGVERKIRSITEQTQLEWKIMEKWSSKKKVEVSWRLHRLKTVEIEQGNYWVVSCGTSAKNGNVKLNKNFIYLLGIITFRHTCDEGWKIICKDATFLLWRFWNKNKKEWYTLLAIVKWLLNSHNVRIV